ncbi:MAG: sulfite exporter TauE/SafE family protein [Myxococcota bacterium]
MVLAVFLSLVMGVVLGLLGGGGSILTVPILVYALGVENKAAIATSLLVVGVTSAVAAFSHARADRVRWKTAFSFGAASMAGAFLGGQFARFLSGTVLLVLFGALMLVTAVFMWRGKGNGQAGPGTQQAMWKIGLEGLVVGFATGLVGAGGGFLVVPALVLLGGLSMRDAVGSSLVVITMKSAAGFLGYLSHVEVDFSLALLVTGSAVVGSFAGTALAGKVPQESLRKAFSIFVLGMAIFLLAKELPGIVG